MLLYGYSECFVMILVFFFKQKTAYEMRISYWSSDVCSSDLARQPHSRVADHPHDSRDDGYLQMPPALSGCPWRTGLCRELLSGRGSRCGAALRHRSHGRDDGAATSG